ncbi:CoA ester lyase [Cnuibacter physcomitrellae]|uniref:HpcH/HpaI aldolase/citrate lyase family protein n=1 Tax=Cnuibacter physcomitrellae TaxID=1619308 RepID=UPI0021761D56|nr:CoA ester lyase [Cnuibacter physcomitrellae]MCS5495758.1 CoA ester lyase [Cnuibacter physcomitrellae]
MSIATPLVTGLYVPGDRPDRFDKAVATGANLVILDLEDAVRPDAKALAREAVVAWLASTEGREAGARTVLQVRVNEGSAEDLAALAALGADRPPFEVRLPKVETVDELDRVASALPGVPVTALVESARGLEAAATLAAHPAVTRLALGESDLASELGSRADAVLDHLRIRLLVAAKAGGLPSPMLSAYPALRDLEGLRLDTERGRALGAEGRVAVHPSQLPVIRRAFAPADADVAWARAVLAALDEAGGGVATLADGEMVDPAMRGRAEGILARAEHSTDTP